MPFQTCPSCGAQFDVSQFPKGQKFTCGACGSVMAAHVDVVTRKPGTARAAPSSPAPRRGPQYRPADRSGQQVGVKSPKAGPRTARAARRAPPERRGRPTRAPARKEPRAKRGISPLMVGGGIGLIVLTVGLLLILGGGSDKPVSPPPTGTAQAAMNTAGGTPSGGAATAPATAPIETAAEVLADYEAKPPTTDREWQSVIGRLKAIGEAGDAKDALSNVYAAYIKTVDGADNAEARAALGYQEFTYQVPTLIASHDADYLRAAKEAHRKRWFAPDEDEDWKLAQEAERKTREHIERYGEDHVFRAGLAIRSNIKQHAWLKDYNFATLWVSPFLLCYSSSERLSELDLLQIESKKERDAKRAELREKRQKYTRLLQEKGEILRQLYDEWMKRYADRLRFKDIMEPYGGRPDYGIGTKTFQDGRPLVVWVFDTKESFQEYHKNVKQELIPHAVAGYFAPLEDGKIFLFDEGDENRDRVFEIGKTVHEGVHQLEFWFTRQRNSWRMPPFSQDFFGEGLAEWLGAVKMGPDRKLEFIGINVPRMRSAQEVAREMKKLGREYPVFPIEFLTSVTRYGEAESYAQDEWGVNFGIGLLYEQSCAFVHFLNAYKDGKYREKFLALFDRILHGEGGPKLQGAFKHVFRIRGESDWEDLDEEFGEFLRELLEMDLEPYTYKPPPRLQ